MHRYILILIMTVMCAQLLLAETIAARIGDRSYSAEELEKGFLAYLEYKELPNTLSAGDSLSLYTQYFDELVAMYIYNQAIADAELKSSKSELEAFIKKNPPQGVRQIPDLQSNGRFDQKKYEQALRDKPAFKEEVLDFSRDMYNYRKLIDDIRAEVQINEDSLKQDWMKQGQIADAIIIHFDYSRYSDVQADEDEMRALYEEIKDSEYKKSDGRSLRFVRFSGGTSRATAGAEDLAQARLDAQSLYQRALQTGLTTAAGEMGFELLESQMFSVSDPFIRGIGREAGLIRQAFESPVGTVFEPHQGMMGDILVCEVADSMEQYYQDFQGLVPILQLRAKSLKRSALNQEYVQEFIRINKPENYLEAAGRDSIRIINQNDVSLESSFPPIGKVEALNRAILSTPEGEFTPLIEDYGNYYLAKVIRRQSRSQEEWVAERQNVINKALQEAQTAHLDQWYLAEKAKLEIVYPEGVNP